MAESRHTGDNTNGPISADQIPPPVDMQISPEHQQRGQLYCMELSRTVDAANSGVFHPRFQIKLLLSVPSELAALRALFLPRHCWKVTSSTS